MITRRRLFALTAAGFAAAAGMTLGCTPAPRNRPPAVTNVFRAEHARPKVGEPGDEKHSERCAEMAVDNQQHERRDQHDPQDCDLIGKRQIAHC